MRTYTPTHRQVAKAAKLAVRIHGLYEHYCASGNRKVDKYRLTKVYIKSEVSKGVL